MELFHASHRLYTPGNRLTAQDRKLSEEKVEVEQRFARFAPPEEQSRFTAIYASDNAAFAACYLDREKTRGENKHLYRIETASVSPHPMALVDVAARIENDQVFNVAAKEYWHPSHNWLCCEYLCAEVQILAEEKWPEQDMLAGASYSYSMDRENDQRHL